MEAIIPLILFLVFARTLFVIIKDHKNGKDTNKQKGNKETVSRSTPLDSTESFWHE